MQGRGATRLYLVRTEEKIDFSLVRRGIKPGQDATRVERNMQTSLCMYLGKVRVLEGKDGIVEQGRFPFKGTRASDSHGKEKYIHRNHVSL